MRPLPAPTQRFLMDSPASARAATVDIIAPDTPRIETHWSRILYVDLFAPARRGSPGEPHESADE